MQVYDTANRLAQEIRDSEEFKLYKKRKDEIHNDPEKKQGARKLKSGPTRVRTGDPHYVKVM